MTCSTVLPALPLLLLLLAGLLLAHADALFWPFGRGGAAPAPAPGGCFCVTAASAPAALPCLCAAGQAAATVRYTETAETAVVMAVEARQQGALPALPVPPAVQTPPPQGAPPDRRTAWPPPNDDIVFWPRRNATPEGPLMPAPQYGYVGRPWPTQPPGCPTPSPCACHCAGGGGGARPLPSRPVHPTSAPEPPSPSPSPSPAPKMVLTWNADDDALGYIDGQVVGAASIVDGAAQVEFPPCATLFVRVHNVDRSTGVVALLTAADGGPIDGVVYATRGLGAGAGPGAGYAELPTRSNWGVVPECFAKGAGRAGSACLAAAGWFDSYYIDSLNSLPFNAVPKLEWFRQHEAYVAGPGNGDHGNFYYTMMIVNPICHR